MSRIEVVIAEMGLSQSVAAEVHAACARRGGSLRQQLARVKSRAARQRVIDAQAALLDAEVMAAIGRRVQASLAS